MSVIVCACVCAPTKTCTNMCEQSAVMLGLLFAFSSPIDQSSIREDRRLLWRKLWEFSCPVQFVSQIHNQASLLMNNTSRAERVFILYKRGSVKALDVLLSWQFECFSHFFDSVCLCLLHPSYSGSKWEERSQRLVECKTELSVRVCGHNEQSPPTFPMYPPSVWTPVSPPAASCDIILAASRFISFWFSEINSNFASAAARWFAGIILKEGKCG